MTPTRATQAKLNGLAKTINSTNADVLALQEVGNLEALDDLIGRMDGNWNIEVSKAPDVRKIRVALASRTKLQRSPDR
jgi:hypothetical protein